MQIRRLAASLLALVAAVASASPNLLVNGSFEDAILPAQNWDLFGSIAGWTAAGGKIEVGQAAVYGLSGQTGTNVLELDSDQNSVVAQTLTLAAGTYSLGFDFARRSGTANATNEFDVLWNGNVVADVMPSLTSFTSATFNVNGVAGANTLAFRAKGASDSLGGMIDNVSVQAVPEPASIAALGLGALGLLKRRKRA